MSIIDRQKAEALISQQLSKSIIQDTPKGSTFMSLAKRLPNMTSKQTRLRVLDTLPMAYWVSGDTGFKQTSEQAWDNVYLTAEELAVIVPIPEAVLDDADIDIMGEVLPRVIEAINLRVDQAVIFGINRPAGWEADIFTRARQAGNNVSIPADGDLYDALLGEGGVFAKVEQYGYGVNGAVAGLGFKSKLRGLRNEVGQPIFSTSMQGATNYALDGAPMYFPENGAFDTSLAQLVVGDWSKAVYAIRQDITTKILVEAPIQDPSDGRIVYNLAQQDMIALRVVIRLGWALPNPATRLDGGRISCPFAYLEPTSPAVTQTVTFTVQDGDEADIEGAAVEVAGARLLTDSDGEAVFNLRAGSYPVKVRKKGYGTVNDNVTVAAEAVTKAVTLTAN